MEIHCETRNTGNQLADDVLAGTASVQELYDYNVLEPGFANERALDLDQLYDEAKRPQLVAALRSYAQSLGVERELAPLLEKLALPGCLTVVTGQQAGLFTGPVYTLYKAVSAVSLARTLERQLQRPVVPVFWIASEDHDFEEVASAYFVTRSGMLSRSVIRDRPPLRTPVGRHALTDRDRERMLAELAAELPEGMYREDVIRAVASAYTPGRDMADGFAALLASWLRDTPVLLVNPLRRDLRELMQPAFSRVLAQPEAFHAAAVAGAEHVRAKGYSPQVEVHPKHSLLYLIDDAIRSALDLGDDPDSLLLRDRQKRVTRDNLQQRLLDTPEDFSAGVLYRPVTQDTLLPVLAYVGGAAELAYHGMMKPIFAAAGRKVPPVFLRGRAIHVPQTVQRALDAFHADLDAVAQPGWLHDRLQQEVEPPIASVVEELQLSIESLLGEHCSYFLGLDEKLAKSLAKTSHSLQKAVTRLEHKAQSALRRKHSATVRSHESILAWLLPDGHEQERLLSPLSILALYGTNWLTELAEQELHMENRTIVRW